MCFPLLRVLNCPFAELTDSISLNAKDLENHTFIINVGLVWQCVSVGNIVKRKLRYISPISIDLRLTPIVDRVSGFGMHLKKQFLCVVLISAFEGLIRALEHTMLGSL